jgi:hypothetical protein
VYGRRHGIPLDEQAAARQLKQSLAMFRVDHALQGWNPEMTAEEAYTLIAAHEAGVAPNPTAAAYVRLFALRQADDGRWLIADNRPPLAYSEITSTAIVLHALQLYRAPQMAKEAAGGVKRARAWLEKQNPSTPEEYSFWLSGMYRSGAASEVLKPVVQSLLAAQHSDGGWSQLGRLPSDAYSTGEALVALHEFGSVPVDSDAWRRGMGFLMRTQTLDGSWRVRSRIYHPAAVSPPYFESGFPYGHDQFISCAATSWAVMALSLALPERLVVHQPAANSILQEHLEPWAEVLVFGTGAQLQRMLKDGLDPNRHTQEGTTPLMMAADAPEKVRMLLNAGANPNLRAKSQYTPLMVASGFSGATKSVRLLLQHGAEVDPTGPQPVFNASAAWLAAAAGNVESLKLLTAKGANTSRKVVGFWLFEDEFFGIPALRGDVPVVGHLARMMSPRDLCSLLARSVFGNRPQQARLAIQLGAEVNCVDEIGMTPLLYAASIDYGGTEMLKILLKAGADPKIKTRDGSTPLDLAQRYDHKEMQAVLLRANGFSQREVSAQQAK